MDEAEFPGWLEEVGNDLARWSASLESGVFDPGCLLGLVAQLEKASRHVNALKARVAEDTVRRDAWRSSGARSAEAWYARVTGTTVAAAARKLGTQKKLADQPDVDQAYRNGDLSDDQADHVAAATAEDPTAAQRLIRQAKQGTARQLKEECDRTIAAKRRVEDEERRKRAIHARRHVRTFTDAEGAACFAGSMLPEHMAELQAHLAPFERAEFDKARQEGRREPHEPTD